MTDGGLKPADAEMIAAFLDRQLSDSERREFMARLDRDEALYEVFVETVRYREDGGHEAARVVEHPAARERPAWVLPAGIAALLALAIGLPLLLREGGDLTGAGLARALVDDGRLEGSLAPDWTEQGWRRMRGLTDHGGEIESAFRVGVHAVDLEVALRLGRTEDARRLLHDIDRELAGVDLSDPLRLEYAELLNRLESDVPPERALALALEIESQASDVLNGGYGYAFGKWAEAGKLAARSGNRELLRSRTFRKMLGEVRSRPWNDLVDEQLDAIAAAITDRNAEPDLEALAEAFTTLIDAS